MDKPTPKSVGPKRATGVSKQAPKKSDTKPQARSIGQTKSVSKVGNKEAESFKPKITRSKESRDASKPRDSSTSRDPSIPTKKREIPAKSDPQKAKTRPLASKPPKRAVPDDKTKNGAPKEFLVNEESTKKTEQKKPPENLEANLNEEPEKPKSGSITQSRIESSKEINDKNSIPKPPTPDTENEKKKKEPLVERRGEPEISDTTATTTVSRPKTARAAPPKIAKSKEGESPAPVVSTVDQKMAEFSESENRSRLLTAKPIRNLITTTSKPDDEYEDEDGNDISDRSDRDLPGRKLNKKETPSEEEADDDPFARFARASSFVKDDQIPQPNAEEEIDSRGVLVKRLMETKRELGGGEQQEKDQRNIRDKVKSKDIESFRETIKSLCEMAYPVSRTMEFLYEDVDNMFTELKEWEEECVKTRKELDRRKNTSDKSLIPLRSQLESLDREISELRDSNASLRSQLFRSSDKISKSFAASRRIRSAR